MFTIIIGFSQGSKSRKEIRGQPSPVITIFLEALNAANKDINSPPPPPLLSLSVSRRYKQPTKTWTLLGTIVDMLRHLDETLSLTVSPNYLDPQLP